MKALFLGHGRSCSTARSCAWPTSMMPDGAVSWHRRHCTSVALAPCPKSAAIAERYSRLRVRFAAILGRPASSPQVLAHATTWRYTNYTFVSIYGVFSYGTRFRELPRAHVRSHAAAAADPVGGRRRVPQHGHYAHDRRGR